MINSQQNSLDHLSCVSVPSIVQFSNAEYSTIAQEPAVVSKHFSIPVLHLLTAGLELVKTSRVD